MYQGISGGNPISVILRFNAAQIRSRLASQPKTTVSKLISPPPNMRTSEEISWATKKH